MQTHIRSLASVIALALALAAPAEAKKRKADPAVIAARSLLFGAENVNQKTGDVDPSRVIISWITNASFAAAANGHVFLLDTFVTRLEVTPGRTPIVIQNLVDAMPEALFIGHGHFDHADNAAFLAQETGATIYASPETCDNMALDATRNFNAGYTLVPTVTCVGVTSRGSTPGAEIVKLHQFKDITVTAFKHLHSTNTGVLDPDAVAISPVVGGVCTPTAPRTNTFPCNLQDPRDPTLFPAGTPLEPGVLNIASSRAGNGGPIAIWYNFTVHGANDFKFVWHNTTGDIVDSCALPNNLAGVSPAQPYEKDQMTNGCFAPTTTVNGMTVGANLARIMDNLGPVDVEIGSVVSLGFNQNGERDIISYIAHVKPKVFIPNHVTAVAVEGSSLEWKIAYIDALKAPSGFSTSSPNGATYSQIPQANWPEAIWLVDPNDYIRPIVFTPSDARWRKPDSDGDHDRD
jgi:hypothetical protein